jgi:phosphonate transport system substrate-binding protein
LLVGLSAAAALGACSSSEPVHSSQTPVQIAPPPPQALVFGFTTAHGAAEAASWGKRLGAYLGARIGCPLRPFVASSYGMLVRGLTEGRVDLGWIPPMLFVDAARRGDAIPLVKFVRLGRSTYHSAFIVRHSSSARTLADLRGQRMAWIDPRSSAGYLFPRTYLLKAGLDPDHFFAHQAFLGSHRRVVEAVLQGKVDVGVAFFSPGDGGTSAWQQFYPARAHEIRILASVGPIPSDVIAGRRGLPREVAARVRDVFVRMHLDPEGRELLEWILTAERALPARMEDYALAEQLAEISKPGLPTDGGR